MYRFLTYACCIGAWASVATAADSAPSAGLSATQIAERNVSARGGLKAWREVNSLAITGLIDVGGKQPTALPFVLTMKRPHKSRFDLQFQNRTATQAYDGVQGWKLRPFLGREDVEPYTAAELRLAAAGELDGPLIDYAAKGTTLQRVGTETVDGHVAYRLKMSNPARPDRLIWIDATSFLEVKIEGDPHRVDGKMRKVAIYYRNYKSEHGLTLPYETETVVEGNRQGHKMRLQAVSVNPPASDALFAAPTAPAATVAAR